MVMSMGKLTFYTLDVFAEEKYAGNQLAVFRNAKSISDNEMQRIAKEINYSETTFIASDEKREGGYDVRIFTPAQEVPFAGHPTLGTAYVIQREIIRAPIETIILNLKVGQIPVTVTYAGKRVDILWMKQRPPTFTQTLDASKVAGVLQLDKKDVDDRFPIQEVSTGLPFIIVPLRTISALKKAHVNRDKYFTLVGNTEAKAILIFCPETHIKGNDLSVRVFVDYFGIPEDPATGSGNGCLAGYLVKYLYFRKEEIDIKVEQGYEIGRPSLLLLRAKDKQGRIDVSVGGRVVMVAKGEFM
jgi:trans-2,3-dihydro-3-hydroxyanthranilate isomerase